MDENEEAPEYNDDKGKRPVASVIQLESEEEELFEDAQEYDDEWTAAETAEFDAAIDDTLEEYAYDNADRDVYGEEIVYDN